MVEARELCLTYPELPHSIIWLPPAFIQRRLEFGHR